jgi:hypothetical protein
MSSGSARVPARPIYTAHSGFYGVRANGRRWQAKISYDGKAHHLGPPSTPSSEAALAYDRAAWGHAAAAAARPRKLNYVSIKAAEAAAAAA